MGDKQTSFAERIANIENNKKPTGKPQNVNLSGVAPPRNERAAQSGPSFLTIIIRLAVVVLIISVFKAAYINNMGVDKYEERRAELLNGDAAEIVQSFLLIRGPVVRFAQEYIGQGTVPIENQE